METSLYLKGHHCTLPEELRSDPHLTTSKIATKWKKFKIRVNRIITVSSMNPNTKLIYRSDFSYRQEQKRHLFGKHCHIIHPLSLLRIYWEMIMLFVSAGIVLIYSLDMGFNQFSEEYKNSIYFLTFLDTCCVLDIVLAFMTGYVKEHTREVVLEPKKIAKRYLKTYFVISLLASMPHNLVFEKIVTNAPYSMNLLILVKMYHVKTLVVYTRSLCFLLGIGPEMYMLMKYIMFMTVTMHWMACLYMLVPTVTADIRGHLKPLSWIVKTELVTINGTAKPFKEQYMTCLYHATCVMFCNSYGRAFPDVVEDYCLQIVAYIFGHVVIGFIFVLFLNKAMSFTNKTIKRMEVLSEVDEYMRHRHFTRPIQRRLKMYYKFRTFRSHDKREIITATLTERLKLEVQLYCHMKIVDNVPIFRELPEHVLNMLIPFMREEVYLPTDIVVRANTEGDCMFFLISGTLALVSQSGKEYAHMQDGEFLGEVELILKDQRRFCTVIAIEISEVLVLEKRHFIKCFANNIEAYMKIIEASIQRLTLLAETDFIRKKMILTLQNLENENNVTHRKSITLMDSIFNPEQQEKLQQLNQQKIQRELKLQEQQQLQQQEEQEQ